VKNNLREKLEQMFHSGRMSAAKWIDLDLLAQSEKREDIKTVQEWMKRVNTLRVKLPEMDIDQQVVMVAEPGKYGEWYRRYPEGDYHVYARGDTVAGLTSALRKVIEGLEAIERSGDGKRI